MRAEDLFAAIGELDEQMIALSERDGQEARSAQHKKISPEERRRREKKRKRAAVYRFAAVAMTTAAAVFILLTARDLIGSRGGRLMNSAAESAQDAYEESAAEAAQDTLAAGEDSLAVGENPLTAGEDTQASGAEKIEPDRGAGGADAQPRSKTGSAQAEQPEEEAAPHQDAGDEAPHEEAGAAAKKDARKEAEDAQAGTPAAKSPSAEQTADGQGSPDKESADGTASDTEKTAVDLLGDNKGDYVKLEILTPEDKHSGRERKVPAYSEDREEALTAAMEDGEQMPSMLVRKGAPVLYVYLTDSSGQEDTVTFYANGYVGISTIPAFVLRISDEALAAVMEMAR